MGGDHSGRRMWGKRPGQPDAGLRTRCYERGGPGSGYVPRGRSEERARGSGPGEAARGSGQGKQMEFVLIGRGERVARRLRQVTEHKLARVARIDTRRSTAH